MYSKKAKWLYVILFEVPQTVLIEIAEQHKKLLGLLKVDYYYAPELGLMAVTEEETFGGGWHRNVGDWKWQNMILIL